MKCKKCGAVMFVNNNIVFTSNPPQYQLYCPECGHIEYEYYEEINLQDLGNHIACQDCEQKDQQIAELKKQLALTEKAFDLISIVLCTGARDDLKSKINKFSWREDVKKFFLEQSEKEGK